MNEQSDQHAYAKKLSLRTTTYYIIHNRTVEIRKYCVVLSELYVEHGDRYCVVLYELYVVHGGRYCVVLYELYVVHGGRYCVVLYEL